MIIAGAALKDLSRMILPDVPMERVGWDSIDVTLHPEVKLALGNYRVELDKVPSARSDDFKDFEDSLFRTVDIAKDLNAVELKSGDFIKGKLAERVVMPFGYTGIFSLCSKHAQVGLQQAVSVFIRGGWEGNLVVELSNSSPFRLLLTAGMVIGQIHIFRNRHNFTLTSEEPYAPIFQSDLYSLPSKLDTP